MWTDKMGLVVRRDVTYENMKSHDEGENNIAQFTDNEGEPHVLFHGS
jgi:hypothetical protein